MVRNYPKKAYHIKLLLELIMLCMEYGQNAWFYQT